MKRNTMSNQPQSALLSMLQQQLLAAQANDDEIRKEQRDGALLQVPGTGKILSSAYEQLRNAAEYTEEHLLLQRAVQRFYNRVLFIGGAKPENIGHELIVELTQAGYLKPDNFTIEFASRLSQLAIEYMQTYSQLRQSHVGREQASRWVVSTLAVETESRLNPHSRNSV